MSKKKGQDPSQETEDDDLDPETETGDDASTDDEEEEDEDSDSEDELEALAKSDPAKAAAEIRKLRKENARRRQIAKDAREAAKKSAAKEQQDKTASERATTAEKERDAALARARSQSVRLALRDYLSDKQPSYVKLAKRIEPFVDIDADDLDDEDAVRDAVEKAVEDFVKDVPITASDGQPIGGIGRSPGRDKTGDADKPGRVKSMFPNAYGPKA